MKIDALLLIVAVLALSILGFRRLTAVAPTDAVAGVELASLIENLAEELRKNEQKAASRNEAGLFRLGNAEVEIAFALEEVRSASGQVTIKPIALTTSQEVSGSLQHRIRVHLHPKEPRTGESLPTNKEAN